MKVAAIALTVVACAAASSAFAATRASDLDYLKASRCKGLADGIGQVDSAGLDAYLKDQSRGRQSFVIERGESEAQRAKRETRSADRKDRLTAELTGPCMAYVGPAKDVAARLTHLSRAFADEAARRSPGSARF
ncbi:MAG: hypothetical protein ABW360_05335, partial [Phenylobacterium sp.]